LERVEEKEERGLNRLERRMEKKEDVVFFFKYLKKFKIISV
jgi:hypothetical protein